MYWFILHAIIWYILNPLLHMSHVVSSVSYFLKDQAVVIYSIFWHLYLLVLQHNMKTREMQSKAMRGFRAGAKAPPPLLFWRILQKIY